MDLTPMYWIFCLILIIALIYLFFKYLRVKLTYFVRMDTSNVYIRDLKIPAGDIEINAKLFFPKFVLNEQDQPRTKLPLIFLNHGWSMNIRMKVFQQWAISLAIGGPFACLIYDCRGHGNTPGKKRLNAKMFNDIPKIFDFGEKLAGIDHDRMAFFGISMGAEVALSRAYSDRRMKAVFAISSPYNAKSNFSRKPESFSERLALFFLRLAGVKPKKISEKTNRSISPEFIFKENDPDLNSRVFLVHARDDDTISFKEFEKNRRALNLPDDQVLILERGSHMLLHQELLILSSALRFFKSKL
ncbi:MAG: alpha/beta hydrolase [Candidatus Helarchaeota archaeon]